MIKLPFISFSILLLISCSSDERIPDVSDIIVDPKLVRFEQELFTAEPQNTEIAIKDLEQKYPEFTDVFFHQIIADQPSGSEVNPSIIQFVRDSFINALYRDCQTLYEDFSMHENELKKAFQYFQYYFPDKPVPDIYTCLSGFEVGSFTIGDRILGIGLDFYLGRDYANYHPDLFPTYIVNTMSADYLVAKSIQALVANYVGENTGTRLIDFMIKNGKELYVKQRLLPWVTDEIIFEYSKEQLEWLEANEAQIWAHLIQEDLLLSVNYRSFQKIVSPSPNVPNMPSEAPGRLGNWIGARIIESYMKRKEGMSLNELIENNDAQKILAESRYKPRQ